MRAPSPAPRYPRHRSQRRGVLQFVAHPNVQQLLASIWYESVPGFRRKNMLLQAVEMVRIGAMFPLYGAAYLCAPHCAAGRTLRKPFIKFLCHSASYFMFLCRYHSSILPYLAQLMPYLCSPQIDYRQYFHTLN